MAYGLQKNRTMTRGWLQMTYCTTLLFAVTFFGAANADQLSTRIRSAFDYSIVKDALAYRQLFSETKVCKKDLE